ncbi:MAG: GGDEF domain-containing protein [Lachnospiraceae bacterium]|nr:GGDEF domain-containing protein [Lachnospiraceae bacterium]
MKTIAENTNRKHKIAVITNGWSSEFLSMALEGVREEAQKDLSDLFVFVTFNLSGGSPGQSKNQMQIMDLIRPEEYDGIILFANTFNIPEEHALARKLIGKHNLPVISTELKIPGAAMVGTGNYQGVYDLACHLIEEHGVKSVVYVSGYAGNEESNIRRQALEDALSAHGLSLTDTMPGDFGFYRSSIQTAQWIEDKKPIPDAFVCANDHMALAVISTLHKHGIEVPGDCLVTGFDQIYEAKVSYPLLATVSRPWKEMGATAFRELIRQIDDPNPDFEKIYDSRFIPSESCGCEADETARDVRLDKMRNHYAESNETTMVDFFFQEIRVAMAQTGSKEEFHETAEQTLGKRHFFGRNYCICTEPQFFELNEDSEPIVSTGFSSEMDVLFERRDGEPAPLRTFPLAELYPGYHQEEGRSNVYIFSPMNSSDMLIGYLALKNSPEILYDSRFKRWINNMESLLITIRQYIFAQQVNRKLREIYMTDFLTGMHNRTGCENVLYARISSEKAAGHEMLLLFADINCMKEINDGYGHLNGDLAIKATAQALRHSLPDDWLFGRYGGDELIAVGRNDSSRTIEDYRRDFSAALKKIVDRLKISFHLSASLGAYIIAPDNTGTISDYIRIADASMYEEKQKAHEAIRRMMGKPLPQ